MAEEKLAEAVRKFPVLYDKSDQFFKDRNKKLLAWEDVAQEANFENGKTAEAAFRNLRNKYGRERRKLKASLRSGAGTNDVKFQLSEMFPFLGWLEPHFQERETTTNFESQQQQQPEEGILEDEEEINDSISVASTHSDISLVTGRAQYRKRGRKAAESEIPEEEKKLMIKLEKRLSGPSVEKDEDALYGELMAANLRKLSSDNKLLAKHDIDNVIFRYLYTQQQQERAVKQVSAPATPTHVPSPNQAVYQHSASNFQGSPIQPQQNVPGASPEYNQQFTQLLRESNPYAVRGNLFGQYRMGNDQ